MDLVAKRANHWDKAYAAKAESELSWFQENPAPSLDLVRSVGANPATAIIDIGGGASRLIDRLLDEGFERLTVLDLSEKALALVKTRLGGRSDKVRWLVADVTCWEPHESYDLWHDRAAFHFLTEPADCAAYARCVARAVRSGGHVIIGTFALDGPGRCSGLPAERHDAGSIRAILGADFELIDWRRHDHATPAGKVQRFQFSTFLRRSGAR